MSMFRTDSTEGTALTVCACGWRYLGGSRDEVRRAQQRHVILAHADDMAARQRASNTLVSANARKRRCGSDDRLYGIPGVAEGGSLAARAGSG